MNNKIITNMHTTQPTVQYPSHAALEPLSRSTFMIGLCGLLQMQVTDILQFFDALLDLGFVV
jgi:hypothetical protein